MSYLTQVEQDVMNKLIQRVVRLFYPPEHAIIIDALLCHPGVKFLLL